MPMRTGAKWSYAVSTPRRDATPDVRIRRPIAVGDASGFELDGPQGLSRLAWSHGRLIASQLGNTTFDPPIPLLDPAQPAELTWHGRTSGAFPTAEASATLRHETSATLLAGVRQPAIKTTLEFKLSGHRVDLLTWWVRGIGIAEQTQRTDGVQDVALSWLSGPSQSGPSDEKRR
jgi:hypothetical protein